MSRKLPTFSSLERAYHCPTSFALPQSPEQTEAAVQGTKNHAIAESAVDDGDLGKIPLSAAEFLRATGQPRETEVAYALDVNTRTVRRIGTKINRNYGELGRHEIAGTIDLVTGNRILDYKSRTRVTPTAENFQMRSAALARHEEIQAIEIDGALVYLNDGAIDEASWDAFELSDFWNTLERIADSVSLAKATDDTNQGPWCKYCPAFAACPAKISLAKAMVGVAVSIGNELSPEEAGAAWDALLQFEGVYDRVNDAVRKYARTRTIVTPSGAEFRLVEREQRRVDTKAVREMLGDGTPMIVSAREEMEQVNKGTKRKGNAA